MVTCNINSFGVVGAVGLESVLVSIPIKALGDRVYYKGPAYPCRF